MLSTKNARRYGRIHCVVSNVVTTWSPRYLVYIAHSILERSNGWRACLSATDCSPPGTCWHTIVLPQPTCGLDGTFGHISHLNRKNK